jgi:hypothetical protein
LACKLAGGLSEFEDAVKKITFTSNNRRIRQLEEATEEIQAEMFRSRHYHHPLSVIMVEPEAESVQNTLHRAVQEVQKSMMNSYIVNTMAQTLSQYLRQTDLILEQREQGRFLILCPDTNSQDLDLLVEYVKTVATEQLGTAVTCGMSTFPDQAITFEELVNQAETKLVSPNGNGDMGT